MKIGYKKPSPKYRSLDQMEVIEHFKGIDRETGKAIIHKQLRYPEGHPMRDYKDMKKEKKNGKY